MTILADIATGNTEVSDVFFLIAVVLFVIYALIGLTARAAASAPAWTGQLLLGLGLTCTALGLLVL